MGGYKNTKRTLNQTHNNVGSIDSPFYRHLDQPLAGFNNGRFDCDGEIFPY